jgi:hypothetical protein
MMGTRPPDEGIGVSVSQYNAEQRWPLHES